MSKGYRRADGYTAVLSVKKKKNTPRMLPDILVRARNRLVDALKDVAQLLPTAKIRPALLMILTSFVDARPRLFSV